MRRLVLILVAGLVVLLVACGGGTENTTPQEVQDAGSRWLPECNSEILQLVEDERVVEVVSYTTFDSRNRVGPDNAGTLAVIRDLDSGSEYEVSANGGEVFIVMFEGSQYGVIPEVGFKGIPSSVSCIDGGPEVMDLIFLKIDPSCPDPPLVESEEPLRHIGLSCSGNQINTPG